jgi:hypothetical protein
MPRRQRQATGRIFLSRRLWASGYVTIYAPQKVKPELRAYSPVERYPSASKHVECEVLFNEKSEACGIALNEKPVQLEWAKKPHGAYILRTNTDCEDPAELWRGYIQLTKAESAFHDLKGDLALRPVYHHQRRVEAHIPSYASSPCACGGDWRTVWVSAVMGMRPDSSCSR